MQRIWMAHEGSLLISAPVLPRTKNTAPNKQELSNMGSSRTSRMHRKTCMQKIPFHQRDASTRSAQTPKSGPLKQQAQRHLAPSGLLSAGQAKHPGAAVTETVGSKDHQHEATSSQSTISRKQAPEAKQHHLGGSAHLDVACLGKTNDSLPQHLSVEG